jgi:spermidine/putrescine transport system substrate-binding protein
MKKTTASSAIGARGRARPRRRGRAQHLQLGQLHQPRTDQKFEAETVKVTVTDYDSNDTALAKIAPGGHGFDIVVPSANYVPIWVEKGLLLELDQTRLENFGNIAPEWVDVDWDPGRRHTVPWQWGTTGVAVNTSVYSGDVNTSDIWLNPPANCRAGSTWCPR